ncbi:MAG: beta-N-acetylglucosaminidase domain-containing protein [Armatimonadota bacterium]|nr:MAG: beta-N-acetylglucosaminidase domain-containing protein [Armatimonadota bacterium]
MLGGKERQLGILPTPRKLFKVGRTTTVTEAAVLLPSDEGGRSAAEGLRALLRELGVPRVPAVATLEAAGRYSMLIAAGDPRSDSRVAHCWDLCDGLRMDLAALGPQGYGLVTARRDGKVVVVLAAQAREGLRHGFATLRQLIVQRGEKPALRQVSLADRPSFELRGVIEGFYGPPWSHQERLRLLDFFELYKFNLYVYAPKDDPYHREKWREPYTGKALREFRQLVDAAARHGIRFCFAISPGLSMRYSSRADFTALCRKVDAMREMGVDSFALCLDDIPSELHHAQDKRAFSSLGEAHAHITNRLRDYLDKAAPESQLIFCPTDYTGTKRTPYLRAIAEGMRKEVLIFWTGEQVCTPDIGGADADAYGAAIGRPPLIWDNYPVNDYNRNRLLMGPIRSRSGDLHEHAAGVIANPMNEGEASKIPLATIADYLWNSEAYRPEPSWEAALMQQGGPRGYAPLRCLAENCMSSFLYAKDSASLSAAVAAFWKESSAGKPGNAARELRRHFTRMRGLKRELASALGNPWLLEETRPYLDKLAAYGRAGAACVRMLLNPSPTARRSVERLREEAAAIPQQICGSVMDDFIARALREHQARDAS